MFVHSKEPPLILDTDTVYDDYKIVSFVPDEDAIHGHVLEPARRNPTSPSRISDEILRWHLHLRVLTNTRGNGEPVVEAEVAPGTD